MKTTLYFLAILFTWQSLSAQMNFAKVNPHEHLRDSYKLWKMINKMNQNNRQRNTLVNLNALDSIVLSSTPGSSDYFVMKYDYDNNGNQILNEEIEYDNGDIDYGYRTEFQYNAQNFLTEFVDKEWEMGVWYNIYKSEVFYNAQNLISEILEYTYNNSNWDLDYKIEYQYNNNFISTILSLSNDNGNWINNYKTEINRNASGKILELIDYYWDNGQWMPQSKYVYEYDTADLLSVDSGYTYDNATAAWIPDYKNEYTRNNQSDISEILSSYWDGASQTWITESKSLYNYDANNILSDIIFQEYDNGTWLSDEKSVYTYDANYPRNTLLLPQFTFYTEAEIYGDYDTDFVPDLLFAYKLDQIDYYDYDAGNWDLMYSPQFFYSIRNIANTENQILENIYLAPNPANDIVYVAHIDQLTQVEIFIFDAQGKNVYQGSAAGNIDVSNLSRGLYIYKIKADEGIKTGKIIIR